MSNILLILLYNAFILAGTVFMIQVFDWSAWWLLVSFFCLASLEKYQKETVIENVNQKSEKTEPPLTQKDYEEPLDPENTTTMIVQKRRTKDE